MSQNITLLTVGLLLAAVNGVGQPTLTQEPEDQLVSLGANVTNQVRASGTGPLNYHWEFNAMEVRGATNRTLILTNVPLSNAGAYTAVISDTGGSVTSRVATLTVDPTFTKITTGAVVTDLGNFTSGSWGDYNNDGFVDLFVATFYGQSDVLYRNNGDGTFAKVTAGDPVKLGANSVGAAWGDYDNDGKLDLYVLNLGQNFSNLGENFLYHNDGDGTFTRITTGSLVEDVADRNGCAWVDYDRDGALDLFVTAFTFDEPPTVHNFLYRNDGNGTFTAITNSVIVMDHGSAIACPWADYDNDGDPDLFVSNVRGGKNFLYRNNSNGTFTKITFGDIVNDGGFSDGSAWGDYDNDGFSDLFVANGFNPENFLYHNIGDGTFTRVIDSIFANGGTSAGGGSGGCAWGDYDNDGFLDLFVANGGDGVALNNLLYHNNGDGSFSKVTTGSLVNDGGDSFGCSWVDYDNNGFLDLFVANGNITAAANNFLYRNNGNNNGWLTVSLVGTASNRSGIGAKVRVKSVIGGVSRWLLREISSGSELNGQNELRASFGLGDATNVDILRIEWPSGTVQEFQNVAVKQFLTLTEPPHVKAGARLPDDSFQLLLIGAVGFRYDIQTSSDLKTWRPWITLTQTNRTMSIRDPSTNKSRQLFYRAVGQ